MLPYGSSVNSFLKNTVLNSPFHLSFTVRIKHLKTIILHGVTGMYNQNECLSIRWGEGKKVRMTALWCRATIRVERPFAGKSRTGVSNTYSRWPRRVPACRWSGPVRLGSWRMSLRLRAKAYLLRTPCPCRYRSWHNGRLPFV